jgi:DNA polymerase-3 subunit delta
MITLIHGGESYLVDRAAHDLLAPMRAGLTLEFNYEDLQADSLNADAAAEKAGTLPFIDALRVLVLRDWGLLAGKRDKGAGAERAAAYLTGIPDTTQLVLVAHVLVAPGNPIYKTVVAMERDKRARIMRYEPPRRTDRAGWVRKLAEQRGLTITPGAVRLLLDRSQPDLRLLDQEVAKLGLYVSPSTRIDEEAVRALVSDSREEEIFALTDALGSAQPGEVAGVLQSLLDGGREPTWLLYTLVSHWRRLLQARAVRDRGGTVGDLQAKLTDHPFVVEKAFRQSVDYSAAELDRGFHDLLRIEEQIKLGELDARLAVEGFILEQALSSARGR